jgi:hypothetical protein
MNGRQIFYSQSTYRVVTFKWEEDEWLNVQTVEPKLPTLEKAGRWLVAQTSQGKGLN